MTRFDEFLFQEDLPLGVGDLMQGSRRQTRGDLAVLVGVLVASLAIVMATLATGCGKAKTLPPGAFSTFDADSYNTLVTAQAALEESKKEFGDNPQARLSLNLAINGYNAAQATYKLYHTAGGGDSTQAATLQQELSALVAAIANLQKQFGSLRNQHLVVDPELRPMAVV